MRDLEVMETKSFWFQGWVKGLMAFLGILAIFASLLSLGFGLLFFNNLQEHLLLTFFTLVSPLFAVVSIFPYQMKPSGWTATWSLASILLVLVTWMLWTSGSAKGMIH